jgi:hypothetical protein
MRGSALQNPTLSAIVPETKTRSDRRPNRKCVKRKAGSANLVLYDGVKLHEIMSMHSPTLVG